MPFNERMRILDQIYSYVFKFQESFFIKLWHCRILLHMLWDRTVLPILISFFSLLQEMSPVSIRNKVTPFMLGLQEIFFRWYIRFLNVCKVLSINFHLVYILIFYFPFFYQFIDWSSQNYLIFHFLFCVPLFCQLIWTHLSDYWNFRSNFWGLCHFRT